LSLSSSSSSSSSSSLSFSSYYSPSAVAGLDKKINLRGRMGNWPMWHWGRGHDVGKGTKRLIGTTIQYRHFWPFPHINKECGIPWEIWMQIGVNYSVSQLFSFTSNKNTGRLCNQYNCGNV
jgi:hypothetical protein